jgi:uncharacterized protein Yka (UPF0111/DUF47 family)
VIGERNIFAELSQIISIAAQANTILKLMFNNMGNNQLLNENMHAIQALEKKSDVIAFGLSEDITAGAVSPNLIDNLIESTHLADNVVDIIFYLSRELDRMAKAKTLASIGRKETEWTEIYIQMLNLADQTIAKLKEMLSTAKVSNILQLHKEIEAIEEKGDDIKDAGFDTLYYMALGLHFLQFYNYSEMLHKSDDILDTCEDFSDVIVTIVTSILK